MAAPHLIAIVGPTASGKSALALDIATRHNGEIICADSRTIYKGMDVGTAKPSAREQALVRHWGLDLVMPGDDFSASDFKHYALIAIADIRARGKLPILVGGTGLYVDSVLYDFTFGPKADESVRATLEDMSLNSLISYCTKHNISLPINYKNKRHVIREIERNNISTISKSTLQPHTYIVGIATKSDTIRTRIVQRGEQFFAQNVEEEATMLGEKYGWNSKAMTGNIYPLIKKHLDDELTLDELKQKVQTADYKLAKRQMTWFRRNPDIMWASLTEAETYVQSLFATE